MSSTRQSHLKEVDALRGIAAVLVACVYHLYFLLGHGRTGPLDGLPVTTWLYDYGWTMVDLFFVISGFVFSHVYLENGAFRQNVSVRSFLVARVARLYPLHLLTLLLVAAPLYLGFGGGSELANFDLYHFGLHLVMLQESGLNNGYSFNPTTWSLSVELFCYIVFLAAALAGSRVMPVAAACMVILGLYMATMSGKTEIHIGRGFAGFFAGYFAWRLRKFELPGIVLVAICLAPFLWRPNGISTGAIFGVTAFPAAVLLSERLRFLAGPVFQWLGQRSYSIYLWHIILYIMIGAAFFGARPIAPELWALVVLASYCFVFVVSDLSFKYFETPMRRWVRRTFDQSSNRESVQPVVRLP